MKGKTPQFIGAVTVSSVGIVFCTFFSNNFLTPKFFVFSAFLAAMLVLFGLDVFRNQRIARFNNLPFCFILAFLSFLLLSAHAGPLPFLAQNKFFEYLDWILFILFIALIPRTKILEFNLLEFLAVFLVLYGCLQHFGYDPIVWAPPGKRIFASIGNADHFGGVIGVLLALSAARFALRPTALRFFLIVGEFLTLLWSSTRAPFVALFITAVLVFLILGTRRTSIRFSFRFLYINIFLIAGFFASIYFGMNRFNPATWKNDHDIIGRDYLFSKGVQVFTGHPWLGIGPGNFSYAYLLLRGDEPAFYRNRLAIGESTHNAFLDLFVETGFFGGISFLLFWVVLLYRLGNRIADDPDDLVLFIPLSVGFFVLQFVFPDMTMMALTGYFLGASLSHSAKKEELRLKPALAVPLALCFLALGIFLILYSVRRTAADHLKHRAEEALDQKNSKIAIGALEESIDWTPWDPSLYQLLGKTHELSGTPTLALLNYNRSAALNRQNPYLWADIGRLAATYGWKHRALTAYQKAIALDPYNPFFYHDAALTAANFNEPQLALYFDREEKRLLKGKE